MFTLTRTLFNSHAHSFFHFTQAVAEGPRATDAFAAVTACCVAALAGRVHSQALAARFMQRLACRLQEAREHGMIGHERWCVGAHIVVCMLCVEYICCVWICSV